MANKRVRKPRKPMTEEQKKAAAERLALARAAKGPVQNLSIHESLRDLPDEHPLSPFKVKQWIKQWKNHLSSIKPYRMSKESDERRQYFTAENYIKSMQQYLDSGVWTDSFWGEHREKKMNFVCIAPAYKNGEIQRTKGVYYRDLGFIYGEEEYYDD